ncbi:MAG: DUF4123 domain-containing protein [Pseudomonadota bacterium]
MEFSEDCEPVGALAPRRRPDLHALTPHLYRLDEAALGKIKEKAHKTSLRGLPPAVSALIETQVEGSVLIEQLSRFCLAATPSSRWTYCRFFDPRVMTHLRWVLTPDQLQSLLGKIERWEFLDMSSHWVSLSHTPKESRCLRLMLDKKQHERLADLPAIRTCLQEWRSHDPSAPSDDQQAGARVAQSLERARDLGLQDDYDQMTLALQALLIHPDIGQHPDVSKAIAMARGDATYQTVTANWSQARWETIQEQMNQGKVMP